ncbi:MAG: glycosyltransferase family 2 protein [Magnetococcus sp. DMHC-6]
MPIPISVILLTKNSHRHIRTCLEALRDFDEVVVCDNGSEDDTLEIVASFSHTRLIKSPFIGFGPLRLLATQHARNDWIFAVDSDEVVSPTLCAEIAALPLNPQCIYTISRRNHFAGKPIRGCGWHPDVVLRIFNRTITGYNTYPVHESVEKPLGTQIVRLKNRLDHYPYEGVGELVDKMQRYSDLYAQQYTGRRHVAVPLIAIKTLVTFLRDYLLRGGFRDGAEGFLISASNAHGVFYKYMKLREANRSLKNN